jgi:hypothetical protein
MKYLVEIAIVTYISAIVGHIILPEEWIKKATEFILKQSAEGFFFIKTSLLSVLTYISWQDISEFFINKLWAKSTCTYEVQRTDYLNCIFDPNKPKDWDAAEGKYFKGASGRGMPDWIKKGLNEDGYYSQEVLLNSIKKSFKRLRFADLNGADLHEFDLGSADLRDAKLEGAILTGADLSNVRCSNTRFTGATWIDGKKCQLGSIERHLRCTAFQNH